MHRSLLTEDLAAAAVPLASVLVVEDDRLNRVLLVRLLEQVGVIADSASTVAAGLEKLTSGPPRLVLLDMDLPDGSGAAILERIRATRMPIKVCVLTGSCLPAAIEALSALHPDAIFLKPYQIADVLRWVRDAGDGNGNGNGNFNGNGNGNFNGDA